MRGRDARERCAGDMRVRYSREIWAGDMRWGEREDRASESERKRERETQVNYLDLYLDVINALVINTLVINYLNNSCNQNYRVIDY